MLGDVPPPSIYFTLSKIFKKWVAESYNTCANDREFRKKGKQISLHLNSIWSSEKKQDHLRIVLADERWAIKLNLNVKYVSNKYWNREIKYVSNKYWNRESI